MYLDWCLVNVNPGKILSLKWGPNSPQLTSIFLQKLVQFKNIENLDLNINPYHSIETFNELISFKKLTRLRLNASEVDNLDNNSIIINYPLSFPELKELILFTPIDAPTIQISNVTNLSISSNIPNTIFDLTPNLITVQFVFFRQRICNISKYPELFNGKLPHLIEYRIDSYYIFTDNWTNPLFPYLYSIQSPTNYTYDAFVCRKKKYDIGVKCRVVESQSHYSRTSGQYGY